MTRATEPVAATAVGGHPPTAPAPTASRDHRSSRAETKRTGPGRAAPPPGVSRSAAVLFLAPALLVLVAVVVYPIVATLGYSLFNSDGTKFVGLSNYVDMVTAPATRRAITNNLIWVVVAPSLVSVLGLVFAVLTERIRLSTAFKTVLFMPMAISFLAAGVTFTLVFQADKDRGALNAAVVSVHDMFAPPSKYYGAAPRPNSGLATDHGAVQTERTFAAGEPVRLPLVGLPAERVPGAATAAAEPNTGPGLRGVVWLDFVKGGGGKPGVVDASESGLPEMTVQAMRDGKVMATVHSGPDGRFAFDQLTGDGYTVRLTADNFTAPFKGVTWLGGWLITPSIITAYIWIWAGFAMVLIGAGLAAIPRDALEAARIDGATEWQIFRRVTVPLLRPVLAVVVVTLTINVLKIFDLVLVLAPDPATQDQANVVALQMYQTAFLRKDYGLGSALGVLLFILVLPAMLYNVRKLRREQ